MKKAIPRDTPQWQQVREARAALANSADYPVLDGLESAWERLESFYGSYVIAGISKKFVERDDIENSSEHPLTALMFMLECGIYPPPELLLGLQDSWTDYLDSCGEKTLEEVFLGKPVRKGGNYSKREARRRKAMWMGSELVKLTDTGMSQEQAAEAIASKYPIGVDAESLVRMARKSLPFALKRIRDKKKSRP